jgi:hypothetical protein
MRILFLALLSVIVLGACSKKTATPQQAPVAYQQAAPAVAMQAALAAVQSEPARINTLVAPLSPELAQSNNRIIAQTNFTCSNKSHFAATFKPGQVDIADGLHNTITIPQVTTASGFWYKNAKYDLRGKGSQAAWSVSGKAVICNVTR